MGTLLTRLTVWLALTLYVAAEWTFVRCRYRGHQSVARALHAAGFLIFLMHVGLAFQFYYHWSHATAYSETARQTKELTGLDFGGGLYVNYLFASVWLAEVVCHRWKRNNCINSPTPIAWGARLFFLFMMINGTIVFVPSAIRWLGLTLCMSLVVCWWGPRASAGGPKAMGRHAD